MPRNIYIAAGLRTPFARAGGPLAAIDAVTLSAGVIKANLEQLSGKAPNLLIWG